MWQLLGGIAIAVAIATAGYKAGHAVASVDVALERAANTKADLVRVQILEREVPKIVTKVVTETVTVEKEVERVIVQSQHLLAPDCVLPGDFGMLLVAAANGIDPAAGGTDEISGAYGCREVLAAILKDLRAGWRNSARLGGLQTFEDVVAPPDK